MKKAQGISLRTIVIAALAIIVMLVLIGIFTNKIGFFSANAINCESKGGTCKGSCGADEILILRTSCNFDDQAGNDKCCIPGGLVG